MLNLFWYLTVVLAIWGPALGGIHVNGLGLMFPFRILSLLLLGVVIIGYKGLMFRIDSKILRYTILPVIVFMLLFACVSGLFAHEPPKSLSAVLNLFYVLVFCLLFFGFCKSRDTLHGTLLALSVNMIIILVVAVFEVVTGVYLFRNSATSEYINKFNDFGMRFPAVCFENTNNLAFNIVLTLPLMLYLLDYVSKLKPWQNNLIKLTILLLSFFVLLHTCSRLGYIVFTMEIILYLILLMKNTRRMIILIVSLSVCAILVIAGFITLTSLGDPRTFHINERSILTRVQLIKSALTIAWNTFFIGVGPGSIEAFMSQQHARSISIHQLYVEILAVYGIIPFATLLYLQGRTLIISLQMIVKKVFDTPLAKITTISTIILIPASSMLSSAMFFYILWVHVALWSIVLYNFHHCEKKGE